MSPPAVDQQAATRRNSMTDIASVAQHRIMSAPP
jgi:hypothetical protein